MNSPAAERLGMNGSTGAPNGPAGSTVRHDEQTRPYATGFAALRGIGESGELRGITRFAEDSVARSGAIQSISSALSNSDSGKRLETLVGIAMPVA